MAYAPYMVFDSSMFRAKREPIQYVDANDVNHSEVQNIHIHGTEHYIHGSEPVHIVPKGHQDCR